jgi:citrate/tricarballylate utilization protein
VPGGIALVVGTAGLMHAKTQRDPVMVDQARSGMDSAFTLMLFLTGLSGLLLWLLRGSPAMGTLLAIHLGVVLALFLTMPYGRFVHGLYRFGALVKNAREERAGMH